MRTTIAAIQTAPVSLRARDELVVTGAKGTHARSDFLVVRVVTSDGTVGYGEVSATALWSGEDGSTARHFISTLLAPLLTGRKLAPVAELEMLMDKALAGNPFTKAGVSTALWDAYARVLGVPLAVALGGPFRTEVPIKLSLSGDIPRAHRAAHAAGFRSFKVKVGLGVKGDVERFALARRIAGTEAFLGADANGGWTRSEARQALRELASLAPAFIEQPLQPDDLEGLRSLRKQAIPIVADESVFGRADLIRLIRASAADLVSLYIGKSGGPGRAVEMGRLAAAFGLGVLIGSNGEFGIGAAAQLHVACAIPELTTAFPSDIIGAHYYAEDILAKPLDSDGVRVQLGDEPGLGVTPIDDLEFA